MGLSFSSATGAVTGTPTYGCTLDGLTIVAMDTGKVPSTAVTDPFQLSVASAFAFGGQPSLARLSQGVPGLATATLSGSPYGAVAWSLLDSSGTAANIAPWITAPCTGASCTINASPGMTVPNGTYPAAGSYYLKAEDASGATAYSSNFTVLVQEAGITAATTRQRYDTTIGTPYKTAPLQVTGGVQPYAFTLRTVGGTPPTTVGSFDAGGSFTFTPNATASNRWQYQVQVTSASGNQYVSTATAEAAFGAITPSSTTPSPMTEGTAVRYAYGTSFIGTPTWSLSGNVPAWLALDNSGVVSGNAPDVTAAKSYNLVVTAVSGDATASYPLAFNVQPGTTSMGTPPTVLRTGRTAAIAVSSTVGGTLAWTGNAYLADQVTSKSDVVFGSVTNGMLNLSTTVTGTGAQTRYITVTATSGNVPASDVPANATSASASFQVYPALTLATASNVSATTGIQASSTAPALGNKIGKVTWTLFNGATELTSTIGTTCPGLTFDANSGTFGGSPTAPCSIPAVTLKATDDGNGIATAQDTQSSTQFSVTVITGAKLYGWDATKKGPDVTISNDTFTATNNNESFQGVRSVAGALTGKAYWEYTSPRYADSNNNGIIIAGVSSENLDTDRGVGTTQANGLGLRPSLGAMYGAPGGTAQIFPPNTAKPGSVVMIAVDTSTRLVWFGIDGVWNGTPGNSGGYSVSFTGKMYPAASIFATNITLKTGDTKYAPPSGFSPIP